MKIILYYCYLFRYSWSGQEKSNLSMLIYYHKKYLFYIILIQSGFGLIIVFVYIFYQGSNLQENYLMFFLQFLYIMVVQAGLTFINFNIFYRVNNLFENALGRIFMLLQMEQDPQHLHPFHFIKLYAFFIFISFFDLDIIPYHLLFD